MVGWTALALAKKAVVPIFTLEWIEGDGKITNSDRKALAAIQETLEDGGIEFLVGKHPACDSIRKNGSETDHVVDEFANMSDEELRQYVYVPADDARQHARAGRAANYLPEVSVKKRGRPERRPPEF